MVAVVMLFVSFRQNLYLNIFFLLDFRKVCKHTHVINKAETDMRATAWEQ